MKSVFVLGILICLLGLSFQAEADNYLTESDYAACDDRPTESYGTTPPNDNTIKGDALKCHGNAIYHNTFKCCYVQYEVGDEIYWGCHFIKNTAKSIQFYKKHTLKNLDGVHILCGASYLKMTGMLLAVFVLLF